ncbi:hypothetical protein [Endozoicomonas acroporae]|uniref:hypothetical protein n=1 Tax=Endozoicomonas acroporae TaxID=1701104 RepID=UPI0013D2935E|nr:hypothetical protein [Endozoicomonas acroporae]
MEARAASYDLWPAQDRSREDLVQGRSEERGAGFMRRIKRIFCSCCVRQPEIIDLAVPGQAPLRVDLRNEPQLRYRHIAQLVSECLPDNAMGNDRQQMTDAVIEGLVANMIRERADVGQQASADGSKQEFVRILESNIVPFNELPKLPAEISREEISEECCIDLGKVDDPVLCNKQTYSHQLLAQHYINSIGEDPVGNPLNWQEVYRL